MDETCIACRKTFSTERLEITGHGWRCGSCAAAAGLRALETGSNMADHLTPAELEKTSRKARKVALLGAAGVVLGIAMILAFPAAYTLGLFPLLIGGLSAAHGLSVKRSADAGRRQFADARVVKPYGEQKALAVESSIQGPNEAAEQ